MADRKLKDQGNEAELSEAQKTGPEPSEKGNLAYKYLDELLGLTDSCCKTFGSRNEDYGDPVLRELFCANSWVEELRGLLFASTMPRADAMYAMLNFPDNKQLVNVGYGAQRRILTRLNIADDVVQLLEKWFDLADDLGTLEKIQAELEESQKIVNKINDCVSKDGSHVLREGRFGYDDFGRWFELFTEDVTQSIASVELEIRRGHYCNDRVLATCRELLSVSQVFSQDEATLQKSPIMKFITEGDHEAEEILRGVIQTRREVFQYAPELWNKPLLKLTEKFISFKFCSQYSSACKEEIRTHRIRGMNVVLYQMLLDSLGYATNEKS